MYEHEKAQMAGIGVQQQTAKSLSARLSPSIPQYGGDCALSPDGLSSSAKRLQDVTSQLVQATWQLRAFFGMDVPENACQAARPSGFKGDLDEAIIASRASLDNVHLILEHLRS